MKLTGREWTQLTQEESNDAQQNYANTFSGDPSFLQFIIFGKRPVKRILSVEGARGLKIKIGLIHNPDTDTQQLFPILVAVDKHGNELPEPEEIEFDEEQDDETDLIQTRGDSNPPPVRCPASCS